MSLHRSLVTRGNLVRSRNVLGRFERILQLRKSGRWTEDEASPFGLPKVRVLKAKKRVKEKKKEEEAAVAGAAPAGAAPGATAPAAAPAGKGSAPSKATGAKPAAAKEASAKK